MVGHSGVDGGQDGSLEGFFIQCGGVGAELLPIVQPADAPPHRSLDSVLGPYTAAIGGAALPAEQQVAEGIFPAVLAPAGGGAFSCASRLGTTPGHLQLDRIKGLPADDALMVVLDQVFGKLPSVGDHLFADTVLNEGLLEQSVPAVFLVGQDTPDTGGHPLRFSGDCGRSLNLQGCLDLPDSVPGQVAVVDEPDCLRLLWDNSWLAVRSLLIAQQLLVLHGDVAGLHGLALAPPHTAAGTLALSLGEGPVEGDEELALRVDGVDILFLEDHRDPQAPQLPGEVEGVHCVAGEAGDGFGQDHIDFPLPALADHPQEVLSFAGRGAVMPSSANTPAMVQPGSFMIFSV